MNCVPTYEIVDNIEIIKIFIANYSEKFDSFRNI